MTIKKALPVRRAFFIYVCTAHEFFNSTLHLSGSFIKGFGTLKGMIGIDDIYPQFF